MQHLLNMAELLALGEVYPKLFLLRKSGAGSLHGVVRGHPFASFTEKQQKEHMNGQLQQHGRGSRPLLGVR